MWGVHHAVQGQAVGPVGAGQGLRRREARNVGQGCHMQPARAALPETLRAAWDPGAFRGRQARFAVHLLPHLPAKAAQGYGVPALGRPRHAGFGPAGHADLQAPL